MTTAMASSGAASTRVRRGSALPLAPVSAAVTAGAVGTMAVDTARDPDLFWHVTTGRWIWAHHRVPRADPFSWTAPGRKWIAHEWLTEAVYASLHRTFGWVAISVISALIIVAGWMFVRATCIRLGAGPLAASAATLLTSISTLHTWGTRPQMISLMFTAVFAWLLAQAVTGDPARLLYAVPAMLLWANLHGGYIFGIAMLWAFLVAVTADAVIRRSPRARRFPGFLPPVRTERSLPKTALLTAFAATAVTLLNPNGLQGFTYPFSYLGRNASTTYVIEWFAPDFTKPQYWPFALVAGLAAVSVVRRRRAAPLHLLAIGVPFGYLAFQSVRNITQFAIVAAPLLSVLFARSRTADVGPGEAPGAQGKHGAQDRKASAIVYAMIGAAVIAASAPTLTEAANTRVQAEDFPAAAARELAALSRSGDVRIFNQYDWGGYLMYAVPGLKVYIDGRPDMYGDRFVERYMSTWWLKPGWKSRLALDGVNTVIANPQSAIIAELAKDPSWVQAYSDPVAVILRHR